MYWLVNTVEKALSREVYVCIYVQKSIQFTKINNTVDCKEKDLELCGIQVNSLNMCIVCIYRAPSGDFIYFLEN
jgi:hypothetical protein